MESENQKPILETATEATKFETTEPKAAKSEAPKAEAKPADGESFLELLNSEDEKAKPDVREEPTKEPADPTERVLQRPHISVWDLHFQNFTY